MLAAGIWTVTCGSSALRGTNSSRSRVTQLACCQERVEPLGEDSFYAIAGGHLQQCDDALARLALRELQVELLPGPAVRLAREQCVTEYQALERLGLALEGVDEVPVVDHPATPRDG